MHGRMASIHLFVLGTGEISILFHVHKHTQTLHKHTHIFPVEPAYYGRPTPANNQDARRLALARFAFTARFPAAKALNLLMLRTRASVRAEARAPGRIVRARALSPHSVNAEQT